MRQLFPTTAHLIWQFSCFAHPIHHRKVFWPNSLQNNWKTSWSKSCQIYVLLYISDSAQRFPQNHCLLQGVPLVSRGKGVAGSNRKGIRNLSSPSDKWCWKQPSTWVQCLKPSWTGPAILPDLCSSWTGERHEKLRLAVRLNLCCAMESVTNCSRVSGTPCRRDSACADRTNAPVT